MVNTASTKKMVVLAIDDDPNNLKALARIFIDHEEYTLHCCSSGEEGLKQLETVKPDLVLLDIQMPGMDGYGVCSRIKNNPQTRSVMVLLLSGKASLADRLEGYAVEADDYITKPFDEQELFAKVKILLRLKEVQDELVAINSDLSSIVEAKTREVVRKERQALVGQMVLGIVHNLRGPLTGSKGMVELADSKLDKILTKINPEHEFHSDLLSIKKNLEYSMQSNEALADLITAMLKKGKFDAQKATGVIDLNDLIREELEFLNADLFFKHKVEKKIVFDETLPPIQGVPADFSQLCYNLIKNALDAMQSVDTKILSISTRHTDSEIVLQVEDTGYGIEPGKETEIFEPFFTTKPSVEEAKDGEAVGTGLGLFTCLEIVKLYNGEIKAESPDDTGCCFRVILPRTDLTS